MTELAPTSLRLRPFEDQELPASIDIAAEGVTFGREDSNQIVLPGRRYPHVSSYHARVYVEDGDLVVADLGSKNGTFVNGRRVDRESLRQGDLLQLGGRIGPRFVVVDRDAQESTIALAVRDSVVLEAKARQEALREASRPAPESSVPAAPREERRRGIWGPVLLVGLMLTLATWAGVFFITQLNQEDLQEDLATLQRVNDRLHERLQAAERDRVRQQSEWDEARSALQQERTRLQERIQGLEGAGTDRAAELNRLQEQLRETVTRLERFRPLDVSQGSAQLGRDVLPAVILIETQVRFREQESGKLLHVEGAGANTSANLDDRGGALTYRRTGSGFCVSRDGWILTSAHVVQATDMTADLANTVWDLRPEVEVSATFSGRGQRHKVVEIRIDPQPERDLALLRIEPFSGIPAIREFSLEAPVPPAGSGVHLCGFPLGTQVPHGGDAVIASTFKGILSRVVPPYLQVDAGVHPGNSGGPVLNEAGQVVGVVTSVQTGRGGNLLPGMGYAIPIHAADGLWPPRP